MNSSLFFVYFLFVFYVHFICTVFDLVLFVCLSVLLWIFICSFVSYCFSLGEFLVCLQFFLESEREKKHENWWVGK